jgi:uncharacterized protein (DUF1800 family)
MTLEATIAANRFGLGATPGQIEAIARDPKGWLLSQTRTSAAALITRTNLQSSEQAYADFVSYSRTRNQARKAAQSPMPENMMPSAQPMDLARVVNLGVRIMAEEVEARVTKAITTPAPFLERWVLFWSNRLTMAAKSLQTTYFPGSYEREAIRPNVLGKFSDLLKSTSLHAGMLVYLDQVRSFGPNAPATAAIMGRRLQGGLNENLAREILELHTVGVNGGYTQNDVTEFARALTGWTIRGQGFNRGANLRGNLGSVVFVDALHEPGPRTVMGKIFAQSGREQSLEILDWLASHPQTARKVAEAVATHFVADDPPAALVARLEQNFISTGGDLAALAQTLINSPQAWTAQAQKFKSPNEFLVSTLRANGTQEVSVQALRNTFEQLGQTPFRAPSPKGWPDTADKWAAPDAILKRVDWSNLAADVIAANMSPMAFAQGALGPTLTTSTKTAISRAQDARQGIVIALMSPEFQRR